MKTGSIIFVGLIGGVIFIHGWLTQALPVQAALPLKRIKDVATEQGTVTPSDSELYQQMQRVKEYLATRNLREALLVVKDVLEADPHNERARILAERLAKQVGEAIDGEDRKILEQQFELWEERWQQAQIKMKKNQWIAAYGDLFSLTTFFQKASVKPSYFMMAMAQKKQTEEKVRQVLQPEIDAVQSAFAAKDWKIVLHQSSVMLAQYPDCAEVLDWKSKALVALAETLQPLKQSADTVLQLEGCEQALPRYEQLTQLAHSPELSVWQETEKIIGECRLTPSAQN